jgi:hypothetical protein
MLQLIRTELPFVEPPMGGIVTIWRTAPSGFLTHALYCQVLESVVSAGFTDPSALTE